MSTIAVNNVVCFILKNFNIDHIKNNVLLVKPHWLSALEMYTCHTLGGPPEHTVKLSFDFDLFLYKLR